MEIVISSKQVSSSEFVDTSDFDKIVNKGYKFVDKTLFIKEFVESTSEVNVILRPRRFGKSTSVSMLIAFLSYGAQEKTFSNFNIYNEKNILNKHCGQYPVIYCDFKDCKGSDWNELYAKIWDLFVKWFKDMKKC